MPMNTMMKYFIYARKSSEDKNRQVSSIEDQVSEVTRLARSLQLNIVDVITESRSAKKPGRKGFNEMLERIHRGEATGILCYKLDRLSRNALDGGQISWMLQNNVIQHIQTCNGEFKPSDNVLLMQVELGVATQYVKDLKANVSRGTRCKAERGWNPAPVLPVGYKHNPLYLANESKREIVPDPKNFEKVFQLWQLLLTGAYSIIDLKREGDALGLKNKNGKPFALNTYHHLFKKSFYAGYFYWKDERGERKEYLGKHKPMVSYSEFVKAQKIIGNYSNHSRKREHLFPYRGLIRCGECSGTVTSTYIHQVICTKCKHKYSIKTNTKCRKCKTDYAEMKQPSEVIKRYYHCTKKIRKNCSQGCIEEHHIERTILKALEGISISNKYYQWGIETIKRMDDEAEKNSSLLPSLLRQEQELETRLTGFIEMKADGDIDNIRFRSMSDDIKERLDKLKQTIRVHQEQEVRWKLVAEQGFEYCNNAINIFKKGDENEKKRIVSKIGLNLTLLDKKIDIITPKHLLGIKKYELGHTNKMCGLNLKIMLKNIVI